MAGIRRPPRWAGAPTAAPTAAAIRTPGLHSVAPRRGRGGEPHGALSARPKKGATASGGNKVKHHTSWLNSQKKRIKKEKQTTGKYCPLPEKHWVIV